MGLFPSGWIRETALATVATTAAVVLLQPLARLHPTLHHALLTLFAAFIGFSLFIVVWIARRHARDLALLIVGAAFLATATFEVFYTLAGIDPNLFKYATPDVAHQLWIGGQGILSVSVLLAVVLAGRAQRGWLVMAVVGVIAVFILLLIFSGRFPRCYQEGQFTTFRVVSEFLIGGGFLAAACLLVFRRERFDDRLCWLLILAFALLAAVHLFFFMWPELPYLPPANLSDILQIFAYIFLYKAVIETGFTRPLQKLYQELERRSVLLDQAAEVSGFGGWSWEEGSGKVQISESLQHQWGLSAPEMTFDEFTRRVHRDDLQLVRRKVELALNGCETFSLELRLQDPAERGLRFVFVQGKVERRPDGRLHAYGSVLNITNRKEVEALREDVERMTRHDIKSPLSSLLLVPELLIERGGLDEEQVRMLETLRYEARRMNEMLNRFLDLHRMELGTYRLDPEPVNVVEIIAMLRNATRDSSRGEIELIVDGAADNDISKKVYVAGERLLLHSMLSHLLDNALEASPVGAPVRVRIQQEPRNWVCIEIENKGEVPEPIRERFFQKYVSFGKRKGTGLGAYTAKLIATTHGGTIQMKTGAGSTSIIIRLPQRSEA